MLVGDEEDTFAAGKLLFEPRLLRAIGDVPGRRHQRGVLRIQVNANHPPAAIDGLVAAFAELKSVFKLPAASTQRPRAIS